MERSSGAGRLILASASPRRLALLSQAGLELEVEPSGASEEIDASWSPEAAAVRVAERKADAVARRHAGERVYVLAADTVVAVQAQGAAITLGKPADEEEARRMLRLLSGTRHRVVTGVCARAALAGGAAQSGYERTFVTMRAIAPEEVEAYVASGEWRDKAGGYAIQESADRFVTALEGGGFDNVVGLPVALALHLLAACGAPLSREGPRLAGGSARD